MAPSDPLSWQLYNNPLRDWLSAVATLAGTFILLLTLRRVAGRKLVGMALHTVGAHYGADLLASDLVRRTRAWFFLVVGIALGRLLLTLPHRTDRTLDIIIVVGLLLQVATWANGIINHVVNRYGVARSTPSGERLAEGPPPATITALGIMARVVLWIIILLVALDNLGIHVTTLIAGLGISGIAIALALQNILGDLFAALAIVLDKPFVVGDGISVDNIGGTVERIGLKTTRVRGPVGEEIVFSNADLLKSRVRNMQRLNRRTVTVTLALDGRTSADRLGRVPGIVRDVITRQANVDFGRAHLTTITDGNVGVEAVYVLGTADYGAFMDVQQAITLGLLEGLAGAEVPLGARTVIAAR
jgi:small-conductance mechanosensitive channel